MQKALFLGLAIIIVGIFYYFQSQTIKSVMKPSVPIEEEGLMPIESIRQDANLSFDLNADSLDHYLNEENPFYSGGFQPRLNSIGVLTASSRAILEQFSIFEFFDQENFSQMRSDGVILEYRRGDQVDDAAAAIAGAYSGRLNLGGNQGEARMSLVPMGADGLVYDFQWKFGDDGVRRFRRIPAQSYWLNMYLSTAWINQESFRIVIPFGAIAGSGLTKIPTGPGVAIQDFTGYELLGRIEPSGMLIGSVYAVGRSEKLGEVWNLAEEVGKFEFSPEKSASAEP